MKNFSKYFENNIYKLDREYITELSETETYVNYATKDADYNCLSAIVEWGIIIHDESTIGIDNIEIVVSKITCNIEIIDNDTEKTSNEILELSSDKIDIKIDLSEKEKIDIYPKDLYINYLDKNCEINF